MDSHSRSASPRGEAARPQHRPPSPPTPTGPGVENKAYQHDEDPNHNESFTSNGATNGVNGHSKEPNGHTETKVPEAVNLELINLSPKNGKKKDVEVDMTSNPYDEYFVPVNEHRKYMRGEKLYVTSDKRGKKSGCKRPLCWTLLALVVAAVIALIILAATGVLFASSPTPVDQYNSTLSSARALGGIALSQEHVEHDHQHHHEHFGHDHDGSDHDHPSHDHAIDQEAEKHVPGTQSDGVPGSNESSDSSMYVPRTIEGELKIDNEEFTEALADPESDEYQEFTSNFAEQLKRALFDRATLENGGHDITLQIVKLRQGSILVTYRINWKSKTSTEADDELITTNTLKDRLEEYLDKNSRMINVHHIAEDKLTTRYILDLCQINKNDCDHGCSFDENTLEFMCTCPNGEISDMNNPKKCISIFEATKDKQKELKVLDVDSVGATYSIPEKERSNTESVDIPGVYHDHNQFDWKDTQPVKLETTTTEVDPELNYSHVFGISQHHDETTPKPEPEPNNADHNSHGQPVAEPNFKPESSEPKAEPAAEPTAEPAAEPTAEPVTEPAAEPVTEHTSEPADEPAAMPSSEPSAEPTAEPVSVPAPEPSAVPAAERAAEPAAEIAAEPTTEPAAEPSAEPSTEPASEPSAEPTSQPEPVAEPKSEQSTEPTQHHVSDEEDLSVLQLQPIGDHLHTTDAPKTTQNYDKKESNKSIGQIISEAVEKSKESEANVEPQQEPTPEPIAAIDYSSEKGDNSAEHKPNVEVKILETNNGYSSNIMETTTTEKISRIDPKVLQDPFTSKPMVKAIVYQMKTNDDNAKNNAKNEWLQNDAGTTVTSIDIHEIHNQDNNNTKGDTNYMDLIKENMNNGEKHETQQRSFKPLDEEFVLETGTVKMNALNNDTMDEESKAETKTDKVGQKDILYGNLSKKEGETLSETTIANLEPSTTAASVSLFDTTITNNTNYQSAKHGTSTVTSPIDLEEYVLNKEDKTMDSSRTDVFNSESTSMDSGNVISYLNINQNINQTETSDTKSEVTTEDATDKHVPDETTEYSILKQFQPEEDKILIQAINPETTTSVLVTTDKDVTDEGIDITFDAINMLYNRSSKSFMVQNSTSLEPEVDTKPLTTTESDWLSEAVTEVNYEQIMNIEKHEITEAPVASIDVMGSGMKDDFEPDYLNSLGPSKSPELDEPIYGMVHDYDSEDPRVKKENTMTNKEYNIFGLIDTKAADTEESKEKLFTNEIKTTTSTESISGVASTSTEKILMAEPDVESDANGNISETISAINMMNLMDNVTFDKQAEQNSSLEEEFMTVNKSLDTNDEKENNFTSGDGNTESSIDENIAKSTSTRSPIQVTTIRQYIYKSSDKVNDIPVLPHFSNSELMFLSNTTSAVASDPAPVWEEYEYDREPMTKDLQEKMNVRPEKNNNGLMSQPEEHVSSSVSGRSTSYNFSVSNSQKGSLFENHQQNTPTTASNINVTIYEVSSHINNNSLTSSNLSSGHSTEYEDHEIHETEMNPFLPEVENNKSLVKTLQEGHDLEVLSVNETQNENLEKIMELQSANTEKVMIDTQITEKVTNTPLKEQDNESYSANDNKLRKDISNTDAIKKDTDNTSSSEQISETSEIQKPTLNFLKDTDDLNVNRKHTNDSVIKVSETIGDATNSLIQEGESMEVATNSPTKVSESMEVATNSPTKVSESMVVATNSPTKVSESMEVTTNYPTKISESMEDSTNSEIKVIGSMGDATYSPISSAEDTTIAMSSTEYDGDYLSVVPIEDEKKLEERELQSLHKKNYRSENSHELNDISDSPKKSDRRTLGANKL